MITDRVPYSPIVSRPKLAWPDGARVAVWVVPNVEHYEYRRSEEHTSELQSLMRISYDVFCLKKKIKPKNNNNEQTDTKDTTQAHKTTAITKQKNPLTQTIS